MIPCDDIRCNYKAKWIITQRGQFVAFACDKHKKIIKKMRSLSARRLTNFDFQAWLKKQMEVELGKKYE